jgi:hypothetical protein
MLKKLKTGSLETMEKLYHELLEDLRRMETRHIRVVTTARKGAQGRASQLKTFKKLYR